MLTNDTTPNAGHTGDRLDEGERFYNLSDKTPEEAEMLWRELGPYISLPFQMPDGTIREPMGQSSDRLEPQNVQLACAHRVTIERLREGLCDRLSHNRHAQVAIDLLDEASLYLAIAVNDPDQEFPEIPW
ncbi:MAG: hypothetical protein AAGD09_10030 [Cyanobacteria bacterium P01_F01_bin.56]